MTVKYSRYAKEMEKDGNPLEVGRYLFEIEWNGKDKRSQRGLNLAGDTATGQPINVHLASR
jgi:hypothetical protein